MFFTKNFPAFLLVALNSITTTMPTAAELKAKFEAEKAERQRREDEERAKEAELLKEIAALEEAEKKAAEKKAEEERLERERKLLEEARLALAAKELADKKAAKERESALQTKTTGVSRASSPVKTKVVSSGEDGDCWPCRSGKVKKVCVFPP